MGNCIYIGHACPPHDNNQNIPSCTASHHSSIKVLHSSDGRISEFCGQSLKAAELMLEFPNHFLVNLENGNHRPSPLSADTDLKPCHAYLLLPMHRRSTRISQEEMACYTSALSSHHHANSPAVSCKSRRPKSSMYGQRKVTPVTDDGDNDEDAADDHGSHRSERSETSYVNIQKSYSCPVIAQGLRDAKDNTVASDQSCGANSMRMRPISWMPKLETISESSSF